jgi:parvulin-like peptidyl-prolyl isomerase
MGRLRLLLGFFAIGLALFAGDRLTASLRAGAAAVPLGDDEILYREALARGLDREDRGVRRRLARNLAFLRAAESEASGAPLAPGAEQALYREALALGMDRTDTVVRRKLVQRVKLEIEAEAQRAEPTEAELRGWLEAHPERGASPPRAAFRHLFFDPARRGPDAERDARRALAALASGASDAAGDACLVPADQPLQSEAFVARLLGPAFAEAVFDAPPGAWTGPLRSSLGWHLVRVSERTPAGPQRLAAARAEARDALLAERAAAAVERFLAERRAR